MKALMIAGDRSGSGKTSITLAIAALLSRNRKVQTFKVGMDYIDPSYLSGVTGRPCRNVDSFVMQPPEIREIFHHGCEGADIALVEGVRGLYEGAEALGETGSTASIAKALDLPVILVVSARSITRSAAAIVQGFRAFDPAVRICGVILNNVSGRQHIEKAVTAIEHYCDIPVIGAIPRQPAMELTMRHLGLVPFLEGTGKEAFHQRIADVVDLIGDHLSIDRLLSCTREYTLPSQPESPWMRRSIFTMPIFSISSGVPGRSVSRSARYTTTCRMQTGISSGAGTRNSSSRGSSPMKGYGAVFWMHPETGCRFMQNAGASCT
jgi:cobyrinic acid a,c-diamide synthase